MVNRRYENGFVKHLIEQSVRALNINQMPLVEIVDARDRDCSTFPVFDINVRAGYLDFTICETVEKKTVQYFALIVRSTPVSRENPPDTVEWEGKIHVHPSAAIREAILKCVEEAIDMKCYDEIAYAEWKGEDDE